MEAIKPQDLRVGNYIDVFGICEVRAINADKNKVKVRRVTPSGKYLIEWVPLSSLDAKPIPLSEQRLIELGFEQENDFKHPNAPIYFANIRGGLICFLHNCSHGHIKYVHQLQNLFTALTGQELTFKDDDCNYLHRR